MHTEHPERQSEEAFAQLTLPLQPYMPPVNVCSDVASAQPEATHEPAEQVVPAAQGLLQPPQCCAFVFGSTHAPLQSSRPELQVHVLDAQRAFVGHGLLHPPQLSPSTRVSTQAPLHGTSAPGHLHCFATQLAPVGHAELQPPQFAGSLFVSTQAPAHGVPRHEQCDPTHE